jgi:hypothetical protein
LETGTTIVESPDALLARTCCLLGQYQGEFHDPDYSLM